MARLGDAARMLAQTGCDSVMVGRAALGNPWIFRVFKGEMAGGTRSGQVLQFVFPLL